MTTQDHAQQLAEIVRFEGRSARQAFAGDAGQAPEIHAVIEVAPAPELLGGHVPGGADGPPLGRHRSPIDGWLDGARDAEVEHLRREVRGTSPH